MCRGKEGDDKRLPEGEEDDELDAENLEERPMVGQVRAQLNIELDEAVHRHCDSSGFEHQSLRDSSVGLPDVC